MVYPPISTTLQCDNKLDEVITSVELVSSDITAVTEGWQITPELCSIQGYNSFHQLRQNRRGGGLVLLVKDKLNPCHLSVGVLTEIEAM